jgi:parvulin-like peptidyl-prolyl isomerase
MERLLLLLLLSFALLLVLSSSLLSAATASSSALTTTATTTIFQSNVDGIRVEVPNGWVVEDIDNTDPIVQQTEKDLGYAILARLCPQTETLSIASGGYDCPSEAEDYVSIIRFPDLQSKPEFSAFAHENKSISISDLLTYLIQFQELHFNFTNFRLLKNIDRVVNVTDSQTNQTTATAPAKYLEISYLDNHSRLMQQGFVLLVLDTDGNTGYFLRPVISSSTFSSPAQQLPPEHQQIFDSFKLVK